MKLTSTLAAFLLAVSSLGLAGQALAHDDSDEHDGDSINLTITVDGKDHEIVISEDGVEVDGKDLEDIDIEVVIDGDISEIADEILDEVEKALEEVEEAIEEAREEHDIED